MPDLSDCAWLETKIWVGRVLLGSHLWKEAQPGEQRDPRVGKPETRGLADQHMELIRPAGGDYSKQEGVFSSQVLEGAGRYIGSNGALVKATRTNSRHHARVIMRGMPLGVFKTVNPFLKHRVHTQYTAMELCIPT